jgi:hypothetical protein
MAKLVAEQITIAQNNTAQLIAEQVALMLAAQSGDLQSPQKFDHQRQDSLTETVESIAPHKPPFQDGLIHGTETQTLDYGLDPTFDA